MQQQQQICCSSNPSLLPGPDRRDCMAAARLTFEFEALCASPPPLASPSPNSSVCVLEELPHPLQLQLVRRQRRQQLRGRAKGRVAGCPGRVLQKSPRPLQLLLLRQEPRRALQDPDPHSPGAGACLSYPSIPPSSRPPRRRRWRSSTPPRLPGGQAQSELDDIPPSPRRRMTWGPSIDGGPSAG